MEERKYYANQSMKFNLDSMRTHVQCLIYDWEDHKFETVELDGRTMNIDDLENYKDEIEDLLGKAVYGKLTGKEYGRAKAICNERQVQRYAACLAAGMSEERAAGAFTD